MNNTHDDDDDAKVARGIYDQVSYGGRHLVTLEQSLFQEVMNQSYPTDPLRVTTTVLEDRFVQSPDLRSKPRSYFRSGLSFLACYITVHDMLGIYLNNIARETETIWAPITILLVFWSIYSWKRVELGMGQVFRGGVIRAWVQVAPRLSGFAFVAVAGQICLTTESFRLCCMSIMQFVHLSGVHTDKYFNGGIICGKLALADCSSEWFCTAGSHGLCVVNPVTYDLAVIHHEFVNSTSMWPFILMLGMLMVSFWGGTLFVFELTSMMSVLGTIIIYVTSFLIRLHCLEDFMSVVLRRYGQLFSNLGQLDMAGLNNLKVSKSVLMGSAMAYTLGGRNSLFTNSSRAPLVALMAVTVTFTLRYSFKLYDAHESTSGNLPDIDDSLYALRFGHFVLIQHGVIQHMELCSFYMLTRTFALYSFVGLSAVSVFDCLTDFSKLEFLVDHSSRKETMCLWGISAIIGAAAAVTSRFPAIYAWWSVCDDVFSMMTFALVVLVAAAYGNTRRAASDRPVGLPCTIVWAVLNVGMGIALALVCRLIPQLSSQGLAPVWLLGFAAGIATLAAEWALWSSLGKTSGLTGGLCQLTQYFNFIVVGADTSRHFKAAGATFVRHNLTIMSLGVFTSEALLMIQEGSTKSIILLACVTILIALCALVKRSTTRRLIMNAYEIEEIPRKVRRETDVLQRIPVGAVATEWTDLNTLMVKAERTKPQKLWL